jgi:hypothetical protein
MRSSLIVGPISDIERPTDTRRPSIWIGSTGPLVLPAGAPLAGVRRGCVFRAIFHDGLDGTLIVEDLLPMPPPSPS